MARRTEDDGNSPGFKFKKSTTLGSPTKVGTYGSPTKLSSKSPTKLKTAKKVGKSPKKKVVVDGVAGEETEKKESGLASPTSISMQNSFIIKNADDSFEAYFQQMRRRKLGGQQNLDNTMGG
jgi:hypothetical protein